MASFSTRPNGRQNVFFSYSGKRHTIRLGVVGKDEAAEFTRRLTKLVATKKAGLTYDPEQRVWLQTVANQVHSVLAKSGLIEDRKATTLQGLVDIYMQRLRSNNSKPATLANAKVVVGNLLDYFGTTKQIGDLNTDDAARWREMLTAIGTTAYGPLDETTAARRCRRARTIFGIATDEGWIERNPFRHTKVNAAPNTDRDAYIPAATFKQIINAATSTEFQLLLAIVRFCGVRCPSEIQPLRWDFINWETGVLKVVAPKTERHEGQGERLVPMPRIVTDLAVKAWGQSIKGQVLLFPNYQGTGAAISGKLRRLCSKCGVEWWLKPFINLRASCERDYFKAGHSIDEIAAWMGHSPKIALKHYNRVVKEQSAAREGSGALRPDESQ